MKKEYPHHIHCHIHDADTTVGSCEKELHEHFTPGCYFCAWEELRNLKIEYDKVKKQRDTLVEAMSIVRTETRFMFQKETR